LLLERYRCNSNLAYQDSHLLCLFGFDDDLVIKDFIRIHVEGLSGEKICLVGEFPDFRVNGINIRKQYEQPAWLRRLGTLLPYALNSRRLERMRASNGSITKALGRFFRTHCVDVILAEFGTTGADLAPVAAECGIPLIVHFHGHDAHRKSVLCADMLKRYKFMFETSAAVMVVSRLMHATLIELGCPADKLIYNPYGPRNKFFSIEPDFRPTILSLGRFTDIKANYLVLMAFQQALQKVPHARLVMAGGGELLETCKTLAAAWKVEHAVFFPGAIEHSRVQELYSQACCFAQHSVTPSYGDAEGTPNTILEAGAAGLPVVATHHAGIADVVVDGVTGFLVAERDVAGMAEAMVQLLQSPALCQQLGNAARNHIGMHFSSDRHLRVLNDVVKYARSGDSSGIRRLAESQLIQNFEIDV
jgi:colanic acid/amylovoran biosynthesis glycosyltransferase